MKLGLGYRVIMDPLDEFEEKGRKYDHDKPRISLLFQKDLLPAVIEAVRVLEYGASKYPSADNWSSVENGVSRYRDALLRHGAESASGVTVDAESGRRVLAHAVCSALFALSLEIKESG